jgi:hypothetical protein
MTTHRWGIRREWGMNNKGSMFDARCSILDSRFSILDARFSWLVAEKAKLPLVDEAVDAPQNCPSSTRTSTLLKHSRPRDR